MEVISLPALRRVVISGGTHGNEMSGIYLVRELERRLKDTGSAPGSTPSPGPFTVLLSNPRATDACRRYMDVDLNRCFSSAALSTPITEKSPYEIQRAQELNALLGPKGSDGAVELICDLHNTTSNMGLSIISYTHNLISMHIWKHLQASITSMPVRLVLLNASLSDAYSLESVSKYGMSLEVGPQPQGVIRADIYNTMKCAMDAVLDWIETFNSGALMDSGYIEAFLIEKSVDYPRDSESGNLLAAIHPQLQNRDFCLLQRGDPVFLTFSGKTLSYEDDEPLYPLFINEAAYYEKGIAFHLARRETFSIQSIQVQMDSQQLAQELH